MHLVCPHCQNPIEVGTEAVTGGIIKEDVDLG
jgi:hypothetical protein